MKKIAFTLLNVIFVLQLFSQDDSWLIQYEKSNYTETFTYEQTIEYCKKLANCSSLIEYKSFGKSEQGYDLPLLIIDKNQNFNIESVKKSGNAILLVQSLIHPGEPEGIDAGMMLIRDIVINKKLEHLIDHVTILFIPSFNVDGHRHFIEFSRINQNGPKKMGWRTNAKNLNLNRDFLKADAIEMKSWLVLFNEWLPDFFIDCHTTDGADYQYSLTYGIEIQGNMDKHLTKWQKEIYLEPIVKKMDDNGFPIFPYVAFRKWHDPKSGLRSWVANPMLSEGYTAIQNRPGLLIETHMLKDYKNRVESTYKMIELSLEILNKEYETLKKLNYQADKLCASDEFLKSEFGLRYQASDDSTMVNFRGIDYTSEMSDLTGGQWYKYGDKKKDFMLPLYNDMHITKSAKLPAFYIIPPEWTEVISRLSIHGINYMVLKDSATIEISSYKFSNIEWGHTPYEGRLQVKNFDTEEIKEKRFYPKGSVLINMNQRTSRVIAHILEPEGPDSYLYWGFFNSNFEQKEYGETYVMEKLAREMLQNDPKLKEEFETKKLNDKEFANDQWEICNWFYSKTKYWDNRINVYPIGKINNSNVINSLKLE